MLTQNDRRLKTYESNFIINYQPGELSIVGNLPLAPTKRPATQAFCNSDYRNKYQQDYPYPKPFNPQKLINPNTTHDLDQRISQKWTQSKFLLSNTTQVSKSALHGGDTGISTERYINIYNSMKMRPKNEDKNSFYRPEDPQNLKYAVTYLQSALNTKKRAQTSKISNKNFLRDCYG